MPNKSISHGILKKYMKEGKEQIINHIQNREMTNMLLEGKSGRGIEYGSLTEFNASSPYDRMPNQEHKRHQRFGDTITPQPLAPKGHTETKPHYLHKQKGGRKDAEIVNN